MRCRKDCLPNRESKGNVVYESDEEVDLLLTKMINRKERLDSINEEIFLLKEEKDEVLFEIENIKKYIKIIKRDSKRRKVSK